VRFTGHGGLFDTSVEGFLDNTYVIFSCDVVLPTLQLVSKYSKLIAEKNFLVSSENTPKYI
jgi:hypothetical protein